MAKKPHPLGFKTEGETIIGSLKIGISLEGRVQKDFVLRGALVEDMLDAEKEATVDTPLNFNAQMMTRQLIRIGSFEGPFTVGMIGRLKPLDWRILRAAQSEADSLGEGVSASESTS